MPNNAVVTLDKNKAPELRDRWGLGPCMDPLNCALCGTFDTRDGPEMRMVRDLYCRGIPPWILADLVISDQPADKVQNYTAVSVERHARQKKWDHHQQAHSLAQQREEMYWHILLGRFKQTRGSTTTMTPDRMLELMGKMVNKQQITVSTEIEASIPWEDRLFKLRATQTVQTGEPSLPWPDREAEDENVVEVEHVRSTEPETSD